jgi:hypothetical protein
MRMIMSFRLVRRVLMFVRPMLPGVAMVMHMGITGMRMLMGMLVQMLMRVRVGMLMQVNHFFMLVLMAVTFPRRMPGGMFVVSMSMLMFMAVRVGMLVGM